MKILSALDMYSPVHDHPQTLKTVRKWFSDAGLVDIYVGTGFNGVNAEKKAMNAPEALGRKALLFSALNSGGIAHESKGANFTAIPGGRLRVLILASHVIQYSSPLFRRIAQDPRVDLQIAYCTLQGTTPSIDPEFGVEVVVGYVRAGRLSLGSLAESLSSPRDRTLLWADQSWSLGTDSPESL